MWSKSSLIYFILFYLIICEFNVNTCYGTNIEPTSAPYDFKKFAVVYPKLQHPKHKLLIEHTRQENDLHLDLLSLSYIYNSKEVIVDLQLNHNLIPVGHFLRYQSENGSKIVKNLTKVEIDLCHYYGTIRGSRNSHVSLSTCNGINGVVFNDFDKYYIQSGPEHKINENFNLSVFRFRKKRIDDITKNFTKSDRHGEKLRLKRTAMFNNKMRGPYNSNQQSSYIELVIVVDNGIFVERSGNFKAVYAYTITLANIMYSLFVPLNIFISLVGVVVWNYKNEIVIKNDLGQTLVSFAEYRTKYLIKDHPNDHAQLLTNFNSFPLIGKSYIEKICSTLYSVGVIAEHNGIDHTASTMAHELGHNLGMVHDTIGCICDETGCIMEYIDMLRYLRRHWSSCSVEQVHSSFKRGRNLCLKNKPKQLFQPPTCGNGFVEIGEQCDCGLPIICHNPCCNPETCMLRVNAWCATGQCCDLSTCQLRTIGYECRVSDGDCDLAEHCSGQSEYCPSNIFKRDTEPCGNGEAYCYNGLCQSHTDQCKLLWGSPGKPMEPCFIENIRGSKDGNCGSNGIDFEKFTPCDNDDILCGLVHCESFLGGLDYGNEHYDIIGESEVVANGSKVNCLTAIVDLGEDTRNPGLAPDGAKCGDNKMCLNQKCVLIESLRKNGIGVCPEDCNGNGVCDSLGKCHCLFDFDPPTCKNSSAVILLCPENCNGNGECNNEGHCHCFEGFDSPSCQNITQKMPTCPEDCNKNGKCNNANYCDCYSGYLPPTCKNLIQNITIFIKSERSNTGWLVVIIVFILIVFVIVLLIFVKYRKRLFGITGGIPYINFGNI